MHVQKYSKFLITNSITYIASVVNISYYSHVSTRVAKQLKYLYKLMYDANIVQGTEW